MPFVNPFSEPGSWLRGNTHSHSTRSDGEVSPEARFAGYREAGYDFLVLTDHDVTGAVEQFCTDGFLAIPGAELHPENPYGGDRYHILALNFLEPIDARAMHVREVLESVQAGGGIAVMAHPYWSGHQLTDYEPLRGLYHGLEVFNYGASFLNGTANAELIWDAHLDRLGSTFGFAADDAHRAEADVGGAWIMVRAEKRDIASVMTAIRRGAFYATQGPSVTALTGVRDGDRVRIEVRCSPATAVRFKGRTFSGRWQGASDGGLLEHAVYECRGNEKYIRVEIIDALGHKAWTNPIYLSDILGS